MSVICLLRNLYLLRRGNSCETSTLEHVYTSLDVHLTRSKITLITYIVN